MNNHFKKITHALQAETSAKLTINVPILANFQNIPKNPVLFLSSKLGASARTYAHVQIAKSKIASML